ncbi:hypothetical protein EI94DRAFT_1648683, partial [Lactarius quietus]
PPVQSPNDWTPYCDRVDFELTDFLYRKVRMSGTSVDTLSQLIHASLITHGTAPDDINLFKSHTNILSMIDSTPFGDVPWQGFSVTYDGVQPQDGIIPSWMTRFYDVWYCDPWQLIHNLLANWDFNGEFDYILFREFDNQKRQCWRDFMSGDWAWKEADYIAQDPNTHGAMLVPLILGSDKTTVSVATGQNEYYCHDLTSSRLRTTSRHAVACMNIGKIAKITQRHTNG